MCKRIQRKDLHNSIGTDQCRKRRQPHRCHWPEMLQSLFMSSAQPRTSYDLTRCIFWNALLNFASPTLGTINAQTHQWQGIRPFINYTRRQWS